MNNTTPTPPKEFEGHPIVKETQIAAFEVHPKYPSFPPLLKLELLNQILDWATSEKAEAEKQLSKEVEDTKEDLEEED